jgi:hypothetical protein
MTSFRFAALLGAALALAPVGCGPVGKVEQQDIEVKPNSGLEQAKALLGNYAKGQPLGSEVTSFPNIVEEVRKADPTRADILEKGFAELQKPKVNVAAKAKDLLKQLEPRPNG